MLADCLHGGTASQRKSFHAAASPSIHAGRHPPSGMPLGIK